MKVKKGIHQDQLMNNSPTTGSVASSGSANVTTHSSGMEDGGDKSLLPHFGEPDKWFSEVGSTADFTPDIKARKKK